MAANRSDQRDRWARRACAAACAGMVLFGAVGVGCRGDRSEARPRQFFPDMDDQPKFKAQTANPFFEEETGDPRTQRLPARGTVPFGRRGEAAHFDADALGAMRFPMRDEMLRPTDEIALGMTMILDASGEPLLSDNGAIRYEPVEYIPIPVDEELLALGNKKYDIYCLPCHSGTGDGKGPVGSVWSYALPNFHDDKYWYGGELGQDGHIYDVIRNGVANVGGDWDLRMPAYGRKLTVRESWAIVAYVRALQTVRRGEPGMLDETRRLELERRRAGSNSPGGSAAAVAMAAGGGSAAGGGAGSDDQGGAP